MKTIIFLCLAAFLISCTKEGTLADPNFNWLAGLFSRNPATNNVTANMEKAGTITKLSASGNNTSFSEWVSPTNPDSNQLNFTGSSRYSNLRVDLRNVTKTGTYSFGHNSAGNYEVVMQCYLDTINYSSNSNILSGSITIDSLTTTRLKGSFNVVCWNGIDSVKITNGIFAGDLWR